MKMFETISISFLDTWKVWHTLVGLPSLANRTKTYWKTNCWRQSSATQGLAYSLNGQDVVFLSPTKFRKSKSVICDQPQKWNMWQAHSALWACSHQMLAQTVTRRLVPCSSTELAPSFCIFIIGCVRCPVRQRPLHTSLSPSGERIVQSHVDSGLPDQ